MPQQPQQLQRIPFAPHVESQQPQYRFFNSSNYGNSMACSSFNIAPLYTPVIVTPSINITAVTSTLQTSVPIYSLASQSNASSTTSQHSSSFIFRSTRILQVFRSHYPDLVRLLPMNDDIFIAELYKRNLLPHNLKAVIGSLSTQAEKLQSF